MAGDYGLFDRFAAAKDYHAIVYQMGNSRYHNFMYPIMLRHPGVVTLHDFCLAGFHLHYGNAGNWEFSSCATRSRGGIRKTETSWIA